MESKVFILDKNIPSVYTSGMSNYSVVNLKTKPELKKLATQTAEKLGVSLSAVLNNELRRFVVEQSVVFCVPEVPNSATASQMAKSQSEIKANDYHKFENNDQALNFLSSELKE
jgi:antitoxin component of RelBE/YafQ-DinJ toxin-antitoxin module